MNVMLLIKACKIKYFLSMMAILVDMQKLPNHLLDVNIEAVRMSVLDFKEIPKANVGGGQQDTFEFFARDFLILLGYRILEGPDRGADGGRDLIVQERRVGVGGETLLRWLVSCKHLAHSGKSVSPDDEIDIRDRVEKHGCQGFLGVYSTLPSTGLAGKLNPDTLKVEVQVFDHRRIEGTLLGSSDGIEIARRYFPKSRVL